MYQQINLADHSPVGAPGPLPSNLIGLSDDAVADIGASCSPPPPAMAGQGWWPVIVAVPSYDLRKQMLDGTLTLGTLDTVGRTVPATANVRDLTAAEIAALPPRSASAKNVRYALNDIGASTRKAVEDAAAAGTPAMQDWWGWTDPIIENAPKLARLCKAANITPSQVMDKAVTE